MTSAILAEVVRVQARRMISIAGDLEKNPNRPALAARLLAYPTERDRWDLQAAAISVADGETLGRALYEIGQFEAAKPWFERAVTEKERSDVHGRVDHESLGSSRTKWATACPSSGNMRRRGPGSSAR
jgi:hypothetical protein